MTDCGFCSCRSLLLSFNLNFRSALFPLWLLRIRFSHLFKSLGFISHASIVRLTVSSRCLDVVVPVMCVCSSGSVGFPVEDNFTVHCIMWLGLHFLGFCFRGLLGLCSMALVRAITRMFVWLWLCKCSGLVT